MEAHLRSAPRHEIEGVHDELRVGEEHRDGAVAAVHAHFAVVAHAGRARPVAHRDLVVMAWFAATDVAFLRPRVAEMANATLRRIRAWVPPPA